MLDNSDALGLVVPSALTVKELAGALVPQPKEPEMYRLLCWEDERDKLFD
jgi:hypothetical protein